MGNAIKPHIKTAERTGVLQVANTGLTEFPREVFQLVNVLRTLDISNNKIGTLPSSIANFSNLKNITASNIRITFLPEEIGTLKKLESVNFSLNELTALPQSFEQLVNLRTINLSNNKFSEFPAVFSKMKRLEMLDISRNALVAVPDHVRDVQAIEINFNQNQIASVSEAIAECNKLKVLRLEENCLQLSSVPESILSDSQISLLAIEGNLFESKDLHRREGWEKTKKQALKKVGWFALKTAGISAAVLGSVALAVPAMGFTAAGVAAGSLAASFQSAVLGGTIASGSAFAILQSVGAAGLAASTQAAVVVGSAAVAGVHTLTKKDNDSGKGGKDSNKNDSGLNNKSESKNDDTESENDSDDENNCDEKGCNHPKLNNLNIDKALLGNKNQKHEYKILNTKEESQSIALCSDYAEEAVSEWMLPEAIAHKWKDVELTDVIISKSIFKNAKK